MAGTGRKFKFFGAFKTKHAAKKREKSAECRGKCFILKRKIKGRTRFAVLSRR